MTTADRIHFAEDMAFDITAPAEMRRLRDWFYNTQTPNYPDAPKELVDAIIARFGEYRTYAEKVVADNRALLEQIPGASL